MSKILMVQWVFQDLDIYKQFNKGIFGLYTKLANIQNKNKLYSLGLYFPPTEITCISTGKNIHVNI